MDTDLSMSELATKVGSTAGTLRRLALEGKLPGAYKVGGVWRISGRNADKLRKTKKKTDDVST